LASGTTKRTPFTTVYRQGDIVLVAFPFTDLSSSKRRPALVVSPNQFNELAEDLVLVAITAQIRGGPNTLPLNPGDFVHGALPRQSEVKVTKLFTIHSALVLKRLCRLRERQLAAVLPLLRNFFRRERVPE
jgi:mRNA interferase MazF